MRDMADDGVGLPRIMCGGAVALPRTPYSGEILEGGKVPLAAAEKSRSAIKAGARRESPFPYADGSWVSRISRIQKQGLVLPWLGINVRV